MNRKEFVYRGALLSLAATGLPGLAKAFQTAPAMDNYAGTRFQMGKKEYAYAISLPANNNADDLDEIILTLLEWEGTGPSTETKFRFKKKDKAKWEDKVGIMSLKYEGKISGDAELLPGFPKKPQLKISQKTQLWLETGKGVFTSLAYKDPSDNDDESCFLTTACTISKGLPDDCMELTTLRRYRDSFLSATSEGASLVGEYYDMGPRIVKAINSRSNKTAIYDELYQSLVLPSIKLINEERLADARDYYKAYVENLEEIFL
jgi:hypothetical protein